MKLYRVEEVWREPGVVLLSAEVAKETREYYYFAKSEPNFGYRKRMLKNALRVGVYPVTTSPQTALEGYIEWRKKTLAQHEHGISLCKQYIGQAEVLLDGYRATEVLPL